MTMKSLLLPPTVRTATIDEVPDEPSTIEMLRNRLNAKLVEGYTFQFNNSDESPHLFSAEINIDNDRLWSLFKTLLLQLPEEIACIYHYVDDEHTLGIYKDKFALLNDLDSFEIEITQDAYLEIGVIYHSEDFLEEAFINRPKYIQYWGMDETRFRNTMADFDLCQIDDLAFIDYYPMATTRLKKLNAEVLDTGELLIELDKMFKDSEEG